jgi:hypothetical protein
MPSAEGDGGFHPIFGASRYEISLVRQCRSGFDSLGSIPFRKYLRAVFWSIPAWAAATLSFPLLL